MKKKASENRNLFYTATGNILTLWLYVMACIYPFVIRAGYRETSYIKYGFLTGISFGFRIGAVWIPTLIPATIILVIAGAVTRIRRDGPGLHDDLRKISLSATDMFVCLYTLSVIISTVVSPYKGELLWGYRTWNMGLASQFLFIFTYFAVSRFFDTDECGNLTIISLAASAGVFIIGILQRFGADIFDLYQGEERLSRLNFISTIGQPTFFSSYMIIFFVLGIYLVWISEKKSAGYYGALIYVIIGSVILALQDSDSAYAALFITMSMLFVISFEDTARMRALFGIVLVILLSWRVTGIVWSVADSTVSLDSMTMFMIGSPYMWLLIIPVACIYIFLRRAETNTGLDVSKYRLIGRIYAFAVPAVIVLLVIYIVTNTLGVLPKALSSSREYLLFNAGWGHERGAILHDSVLSYFELLRESPMRAVFGSGADMFYHVYLDHVSDWTGSLPLALLWTNAHNEWLTPFFNYGIPGGIAYTGIFVTAIAGALKNRRKVPAVTAVAVCTIAYMAHNLFCYQQFVSTPCIFVIVGVGERLIRSYDNASR